jgi:[acyl-carrier-protein] S-malonyltransferase
LFVLNPDKQKSTRDRITMTNQQIAFLFPGQGSQGVGMGKDLADAYPIAAETFAEADDILGFSLSEIIWQGAEATLNDTINTQPALLTHSVAALRVLAELAPQLDPVYVAGHSMGQISALVAARAISFPAALKLARRRGELMAAAGETSPGGMAAILGLGIPALETICSQASRNSDIVRVANDNCPGQVVISGTQDALERAMDAAKENGAKRVVRLAVSIGAHSPLMEEAQQGFNQAVAEAALTEPAIPVIGNVSAKPLTTPEAIRAELQAQLTARVRWTESIQTMRAQGVDTFIEIGSGTVLSGLVRRIDRKSKRFSFGAPEDLETLTPTI